jgi:hypothetical protein
MNNTKIICDYAFGIHTNYDGLSGALIIPNSTLIIGEHAFYDQYHLSGNLNIPSSVHHIWREAFYNAKFDGTLTLVPNLLSIGDSSFLQCNFSSLVFNSFDKAPS